MASPLPPQDRLIPVDYDPFADDQGLDQTYAMNTAEARANAERQARPPIDNNVYRFASDDLSQGDFVVGINRNPQVSDGFIQGRDGWTGGAPARFDYPTSRYTNPFATPEYGVQSSPTNPVISDAPPEIPPGFSETRGFSSQYRDPRSPPYKPLEPEPRGPSGPYRSNARLIPVDYDPFADTAGANAAWVRPGQHTYNTPLQPAEETAFRGWLQQNNVPFNPERGVTDYDMRGFYRALQTGDPQARPELNQNDQRLHYPDTWKTPYHQTFSQGSQWATPDAPRWLPDGKLVDIYNNVLFDEMRPQALQIR